MPSRKVSLVVGADGGIGQALVGFLTRTGTERLETTRRRETIAPGRVFLDLADDPAGWLIPYPISVAYFCAAVTSLERCRSDPQGSALVNVQHTVDLARRLVAQGVFVVYLSTNLVYDGTEPFQGPEAPACPQTEYGRQKAAVERQLLDLGAPVAVVRVTKVIGPDMPLLQGWRRALRSGEIVHPFADLVMAPVPLGFLLTVLDRVAALRVPGIMQVSGERDISYAEAAFLGAAALGADAKLVHPVHGVHTGRLIEPVPRHTTLNGDCLHALLGRGAPEVARTIETAFAEPQRLGVIV